jgi:hypothetical protein
MRGHSFDRPAPGVLEILGNCEKRRIEQFATRNDDEICPETRRACQLLTEHLSNQPLGPVSVHRPAKLSRGDQAQSRQRLSVWQDHEREVAAMKPAASLEYVLELAAAPNPALLREAA